MASALAAATHMARRPNLGGVAEIDRPLVWPPASWPSSTDFGEPVSLYIAILSGILTSALRADFIHTILQVHAKPFED
jgi:hypothetical protein